MAVTHTTPLTTTTRPPADASAPAADGARFEAPLYTVPFPVHDCQDACVDTRDLVTDEDLVRI